MGRSVIGPLTAIVGRADPKLNVQAIETLGAMNDRKAVLCLLAPCLSDDSDENVRAAAAKALRRLVGGVPTRAEAIGMLTDAARAHFDR
ncbi:MAG: HEAT repeat domain-containing protein, partial [Planctomycetes bacterium]|nr:HEAT repeat domain-containing protein [Planctomycetota bacterium]